VNSVKRAGVDKILFSFPQVELKKCSKRVVETLRTLHEEHVKVYQLYAASDSAFSEKNMVGEVLRFNEKCEQQFDGVAVNNEAFVKCCDDSCDDDHAVQFLRNMKETKRNAFPLPFHFSISWHWGECSPDRPFKITLDGVTKSATEHMIDIVDSVDVQVAWSEASEMIRRARVAGYSSSSSSSSSVVSSSSQFFVVLAYTNRVPNNDCRLTFFPYQEHCAVGESTQQGLFETFDTIERELKHAQGGIHYYSDAYFSNLPGWPSSSPRTHHHHRDNDAASTMSSLTPL